MNRKNFVRILGAAALLPGISVGKSYLNDEVKRIKPAKLKKGDRIGLIAPGGFITEKELQEAVDNLKTMGFIPVPSPNILHRFGYLAGKDSLRAADLNEMFSRKDIDGIVCARGGYGCTRILPMLDYEVIKKNPKVIVGYSDITALLYAIYSRTGLVCFHGPVGISTFNTFSIQYFGETLMHSYDSLQLISMPEDSESDFDVKTITSGTCTGELVGGNLSIAVSMIGTPYDINYDGKIIFIEEVDEQPYRIDRMITQMIQAGKFSKASGIALGLFSKCEAKEKDPASPRSFSLFEVLMDRLSGLGIPVIYGLSFGHITNKFTLPFGIKAELNTFTKRFTLLEPAVL